MRALTLSDLGAGVGYVVKYLSKVHKTVVEEKFDRKSVLTLAMMWIFKKRAYSVARGFEGLVVEDGEDEAKRYAACARLKYVETKYFTRSFLQLFLVCFAIYPCLWRPVS